MAPRYSRTRAVPPRIRRRHRSDAQPQFHLRRQDLCRLPGRYARLGAACQWRAPGRPLVQISPAARHLQRRRRGAECADRGADGCAARAQYARHHGRALRWPRRREPEPLAVAEIRCAVDQPADEPVLQRGLLLQDLHVAGEVLGACVRADHPQERRARPRGDGAGPRPLREGLRPLRRARHRLGGPRASWRR